MTYTQKATPEKLVSFFCGMIHCFILWNATTIHFNTGIHDPYADEVNENWPFLRNNFDKAQYELIVEKKSPGTT
jgi:hypothetical protein